MPIYTIKPRDNSLFQLFSRCFHVFGKLWAIRFSISPKCELTIVYCIRSSLLQIFMILQDDLSTFILEFIKDFYECSEALSMIPMINSMEISFFTLPHFFVDLFHGFNFVLRCGIHIIKYKNVKYFTALLINPGTLKKKALVLP